MRKSEGRERPEQVKVVMLAGVLHRDADGPAQELVAGSTVTLRRETALRLHARGLADVQGYEPSLDEWREAALAALDAFDDEQRTSGMQAAAWEAVGFNRRRLDRLAQLLSPAEPLEVA